MSNKCVNIALLGVHSPNYYAQEYHVYDTCLEALEILEEPMNIKVYGLGLAVSADDAQSFLKRADGKDIDFLLVLNAGFSMGDVMLCLENCPYPIGIWAVPEPIEDGDIKLHSMVSANMYSSIAKRNFSKPHFVKWFYGKPDDKMFSERFNVTVQALRARKTLIDARIGYMGAPAPTFYNFEQDTTQLEERFRLKIIPVTVNDIINESKNVSPEQLEMVLKKIDSSSRCNLCDRGCCENAARAFIGLYKTCVHLHLDALAADCWPTFQDAFGIVPCVVFSLISDTLNIPVACEGDLGAALTMLLTFGINGKNAAVMDMGTVSPDDNDLQLWHCGIGTDDIAPCVDKRTIINHPMMGRKEKDGVRFGLSYNYVFKQQRLTVCRLTDKCNELFSFSGDVLDKSGGFDGTRGFIGNFMSPDKACIDIKDIAETIFSKGIEHHLVVTPFISEDVLHEIGTLLKIRNTEICKYKNYV